MHHSPGIVAESSADKHKGCANQVGLHPSWIMVSLVSDVRNQQAKHGRGNDLIQETVEPAQMGGTTEG